jgi:IMP dehydrogenase
MREEIPTGLSFDDVLLVPQHSTILPSEADLHSELIPSIPLNIPVLSSAMDTVSEDRLAIALAREGGMGVIHRNCTIEDQARMVRKVKRSESTVIENPMTVSANATLGELHDMVELHGISGFPVVDDEHRIKGIITRRDTWIVSDQSNKVSDYMTPLDKLVTCKVGCPIDEAMRILHEHRIEKLPVINKDGKLVGLITSADVEKQRMFTDAAKDDDGHLRVGGAIGVEGDAFERAQTMLEAGCDAVFIDAATGHTARVISLLERLKSEIPDLPVVAGNVVTAEGAGDLIAAGAAAIKVGVGPGSICTTRIVAGVGVPQFTAVSEVSPICKDKGIALIADGGIRYSGDIIKALAAGANLVMLGSLLAGTEESPGNLVRSQGRAFKQYRGMGSVGAMRKGSSDRYGQNSSGKLVPEGVEGRVPYKGPLGQLMFQLMGGVRSGMGYVGASNLSELHKNAKFVRITAGGLKESHTHDIHITEEPINYSAT